MSRSAWSLRAWVTGSIITESIGRVSFITMAYFHGKHHHWDSLSQSALSLTVIITINILIDVTVAVSVVNFSSTSFGQKRKHTRRQAFQELSANLVNMHTKLL